MPRTNTNGKAVLHASLALFRKDPQMIWLPVIATIASCCTLALIGLPLLVAMGSSEIGIVIAIVLASVGATSVTILFNVALVFAATDRIEGRTPTVGGSIAKAWTRRATIFKWALLSAVVGTVIRAIERRAGILSMVAGFTAALAWGVATYMVIPVLAFEDVGPIEAVNRSSALLTQRFGTVGRSGLRFGLMLLPFVLVPMIVTVAGISVARTDVVAGVLLAGIGILALTAVAMYASAAGMYMRTILYRFVTGQAVPDLGVDLARTFQPVGASLV